MAFVDECAHGHSVPRSNRYAAAVDPQARIVLTIVALVLVLVAAGAFRRWVLTRANQYGARKAGERAQASRDAWTKGSTRWTDTVVLGTDAPTAARVVEAGLERIKGVQRVGDFEWSVKVISDDDHRIGLHPVDGGSALAVRYYPSASDTPGETTMTLSDWQRIVQRVREAAAQAGVTVGRGSVQHGRVEEIDRHLFRHHLVAG